MKTKIVYWFSIPILFLLGFFLGRTTPISPNVTISSKKPSEIAQAVLDSLYDEKYELIHDRDFERWKRTATYNPCLELAPCDTSEKNISVFIIRRKSKKYVGGGRILFINNYSKDIIGYHPFK